jgi:hypothetical protein
VESETTINGLDPKVVAKAKQQAARAERYRIEMLQAMRLPGLEQIIDQAIEEGHEVNEVALECCKALKWKNECDQRVAAFRRDAAELSTVPIGDAPFEYGRGAKGEPNKNIVAGFKRKKYDDMGRLRQ